MVATIQNRLLPEAAERLTAFLEGRAKPLVPPGSAGGGDGTDGKKD